jgi:hypothetical protein
VTSRAPSRVTTALRAFGVAALLWCGACARGCGGDHVAEVEVAVERVDRDQERAIGRWQHAEVGSRLAMGDGLRTGKGAHAELSLDPEGRLFVQADTTLRFERKAPGQARSIELQTGAVEIESISAPVVLTTEAGAARVEKGARLRARREGKTTRLEVTLGKVQIERDGQSRQLAAGEQFELLVGRPLLEPPEPAPPPPTAAVPEARDAGPPPVAESGPLRFESGPSVVELSIAAGESATLHDPSPPIRVALGSAACPGELALETSRDGFGSVDHRVRGRGRAAVELPAGRHRYRVRCMEGGGIAERVSAMGTLIVVRDPGERRLPERAPAATVDADSRRYTVRYQNLLPVLTLRWPSAPAAARYTLELRPERGAARTRVLTAPTATLPGGELGEGTHAFRFSAGGATSPEGSLRIAFDNAARVAYLSEPRDRSFVPGAVVRLRGAALARATVDVAGVPVVIDPQGRFDAKTTVDPQAFALALRVHSPGVGVHYFLRRVASVHR